jgi:MOSC domain-containing protein YiiM
MPPLNPASPLARLMHAPVRPGTIVWIGIRATRRLPMDVLQSVDAVAGAGLAGDHYGGHNGERQVTLIQAESLQAIASHLGRADVSPLDLRRNLVTAGINLYALKERRFRVGDALLEATGECHPCSRLEETLGVGGYNAVRGFGGITARVLSGGGIALGSAILPDA